MIVAKQLRQKILDLAIRGKLVPQSPKDEPAEKLLERIYEERRKATPKGRACRSATAEPQPIPYAEKPYDLPRGWTWARLGEVFSFQAGKNISASLLSSCDKEGLYPCFGGNGVRGYLSYFSHEGVHAIVGRQGALCGNVRISKDKFYATEHAVVVSTFCDMTPQFAYHFLTKLNLNQYATATAQPGLSVKEITKVLMPLPPLAEQKRIVAKVEELLADVEKYDAAVAGLAETSDALQKKILDLAIRGKLTKQDPKDEPAEELLKRIYEERRKAAPKGRACRSATAEPQSIPDTEKPFDLPKGWAWCRGSELFVETETKLPNGTYFDYVDIDAIDNKRHTITKPKHMLVKDAPSRASRGIVKGDTLFAIVRPYLENIAMIDESNKDCIASTGFFVCRSSGVSIPEYVFTLMTTPYVIQGLNAFMKGDNSPSIRKENILRFLFPIPPLAEQKRIVERVESLQADIETLKNGAA